MTYPIHDLYIRTLEAEQIKQGSRLQLLRYSDHVLRRFGSADFISLEADQVWRIASRKIADEVWALLEGRAGFSWLDQRATSPTSGASFQLDCERPTMVLVPFGVDFEVRAIEAQAQLLRIATHEDQQE